MANTAFEATYLASQKITAIFDIAWAIQAGLWNLRKAATQYFLDHPEAENQSAKDALVKDLHIHGLNLKRIATELSWDEEEHYVSELLLINAMAIFDTWVDRFVDSVLVNTSKTQREKRKEELKKGEVQQFEIALTSEPKSKLAGSFNITAQRQDAYIHNLFLIYKYFKACRNCCAHGNQQFTDRAEQCYKTIQNLKKEDCGINEFPMIAATKEGNPVRLPLRGIVELYDIVLKIINHYDVFASDKVAIEQELLSRWEKKPFHAPVLERSNAFTHEKNVRKRNSAIVEHMVRRGMYSPNDADIENIYSFLLSHNVVPKMQ